MAPENVIRDHSDPDMVEVGSERDTAPDSGVKYRPEALDG